MVGGSERHNNKWNKYRCDRYGYLPGLQELQCVDWGSPSTSWKLCGPVISPIDAATNSCGLGHDPYGDGFREKYFYGGEHRDKRLSDPTPECRGNPNLPANTQPGKCGTWVTLPHEHCADDPNDHPPGCPTTGGTSPPPTTGTTSPPTTGDTTSTTRPERPSRACRHGDAIGVFRAAVEDLPDPGLGIQPSAHGYVRVPMKAFYSHDPSVVTTTRIDGDLVVLRMWVSRLSWSFTELGTLSGTDLGDRTFHRYAPNHNVAATLTSPVTVAVGGQAAAYLRSSSRAGYQTGYPITITVVWSAQCREHGTSGWTDLGDHVRQYDHAYTVYAIRSRLG